MKWFWKLFWSRCHFCGKKKEWFFYLWELPDVMYKDVDPEKYNWKMCTDCVKENHKNINETNNI